MTKELKERLSKSIEELHDYIMSGVDGQKSKQHDLQKDLHERSVLFA